jgi:hypothetical protein
VRIWLLKCEAVQHVPDALAAVVHLQGLVPCCPGVRCLHSLHYISTMCKVLCNAYAMRMQCWLMSPLQCDAALMLVLVSRCKLLRRCQGADAVCARRISACDQHSLRHLLQVVDDVEAIRQLGGVKKLLFMASPDVVDSVSKPV